MTPAVRRSDPELRTSTLVTGAGGFLGAHVVAAAVAAERARDARGRVVGAARDPGAAPRFGSPRDAARWVGVDLAAPHAADELLAELSPLRVLHCAALARVAACEDDPAAAENLNARLAGELARACARLGIRLVHVSTDLVFGAREAPAGGFAEDAAPEPVSAYGRTKAAGELAVLDAHPAALVARLPLLYGDSAGRGAGASDSLLAAVERGEVPALFVDEWRTPLEVENAAEALVELARGERSGILHVAGPERVTRHELGLAVLEAMGLAPGDARPLVRAARRAEVPTRGARPGDVSLSSAAARALLSTELLGVRAGLQRAMR